MSSPPLERTVRKALEDRSVLLGGTLQAEAIQQTKREDDARIGRERIAAMQTEIAEIEAFLARQ